MIGKLVLSTTGQLAQDILGPGKRGHFRTRALKREPHKWVVTKADEKTAAAVSRTVTESNMHL